MAAAKPTDSLRTNQGLGPLRERRRSRASPLTVDEEWALRWSPRVCEGIFESFNPWREREERAQVL